MRTTLQQLRVKNDLKYWGLVLLACYGPIIIVYILMSLVSFSKSASLMDMASVPSFLMPPFILPVISVNLVFRLTKDFDNEHLFIIPALFLCSCPFVAVWFESFNWQIPWRITRHPDNGTLMVMAFQWQAGLVVTIAGLIICFVRLHRKKQKSPLYS